MKPPRWRPSAAPSRRSRGRDFDLDEVLQAVVEEAAQLCRADSANIAVRDGDAYRMRAFTGFSPEFQELVRSVVYTPTTSRSWSGEPSSTGAWCISRTSSPTPSSAPNMVQATVRRAGGIRTTWVVVAMHGQLVGVIAAARNQAAVLRTGARSRPAIRRPGCDRDPRRSPVDGHPRGARARDRGGQVLQSISRSTFELDAVLQAVLDNAVRLSHADQGNITREIGGEFRARVFSDDVPQAFRELMTGFVPVPGRGSAMGRALLERAPIQIVDVLADPDTRLPRPSASSAFEPSSESRCFATVSRSASSRLAAHVQEFSASEISLLKTFADQAVLAIENVRLFETIERQRTELARYAPQAAALLSSAEGEQLLAGHRREITALFADLRGFTAFAEKADPEEVLGVLRAVPRRRRRARRRQRRDRRAFRRRRADGLLQRPDADRRPPACRGPDGLRDARSLRASSRQPGASAATSSALGSGSPRATRPWAASASRAGTTTAPWNLRRSWRRACHRPPKAGQILISQRVMAAVEERDRGGRRVPELDLKGFSSATTAFAVRGGAWRTAPPG